MQKMGSNGDEKSAVANLEWEKTKEEVDTKK